MRKPRNLTFEHLSERLLASADLCSPALAAAPAAIEASVEFRHDTFRNARLSKADARQAVDFAANFRISALDALRIINSLGDSTG